jgi:chromosome segregation ATPase
MADDAERLRRECDELKRDLERMTRERDELKRDYDRYKDAVKQAVEELQRKTQPPSRGWF